MDGLKQIILQAPTGTGAIEQAIRQAPFSPRNAAFTSLLQLLGKARQPDKALELFEVMKNVAGVKPNTFSYSAIISALAKVGRWQEAEDLWEEMLQRSDSDVDCRPNTVTFSSMISAYEKGGQVEKALNIFKYQQHFGMEPDLITYHSLFRACESAANAEAAIELLDKMHGQGLTGSVQMYNSILSSCMNNCDLALEVYNTMQYLAGAEPNVQTINLMFLSCISAMEKSHCLFLLEQAVKAGCPLSAPMFNAILRMLVELKDWINGAKVVNLMQKMSMQPDSGVLSAIAHGVAYGSASAAATFENNDEQLVDGATNGSSQMKNQHKEDKMDGITTHGN